MKTYQEPAVKNIYIYHDNYASIYYIFYFYIYISLSQVPDSALCWQKYSENEDGSHSNILIPKLVSIPVILKATGRLL